MLKVIAVLWPLQVPWWSWLLAGPACLVLFLAVMEVVLYVRLSRTPGVRAALLARTPFGMVYRLGMTCYMHNQDRLPELFASYFDNFAPHETRCVELHTVGERLIFTDEPEHVQAVLATSFSTYGKGKQFNKAMKPFLGDSIFTTDGERWRHSRVMMRPMFLKARLQKMELYNRWTEIFLTKIPPAGGTIDVCDLFYRLSMDIATDYLLGRGVNVLENPDDEFAATFDLVQYHQTLISLTGPMAALYPRGPYERALKRVNAYVEPFIEFTLALNRSDLEKLSKSNGELTLLHLLALETRDRKAIRDQIMSILLAGRDTSASVLAWTIYEISHYPEVWTKLRNSVLERLGTEQRPDYRDVKELTFLKHCLNESLRLYPVLFSNVRVGLNNTTLPGKPGQPDIAVLKGDSVMYNVWSLHRRRDLYPPVSETFADPRIWSPERWEHWSPKQWQFVPFNAGPRVCPGQEFAMTEMAFIMIRLLQKYERVEYRGDWAAQRYRVSLIGRPSLGVPVAFYEPEPAA